MQVSLLGSLRVVTLDGAVEISATQQRILLARLAVDAGRLVRCEQLAAVIWGDPLPGRWRKDLPPLIHRLRGILRADGRRIVTKSPGYRLDVEPQDVDIWAFSTLRKEGVAAAQAGDWQRASQILAKAEALWHGAPFTDVESAELREAHQRYLEDQRLDAQETRLDADVRLGLRSARTAVPDLREMVANDPASDHLRWLLMLALYRAGRQADAQAAFRDAWRYSTVELATEPGPALRALNDRIIAGDRALLREPFADAVAV